MLLVKKLQSDKGRPKAAFSRALKVSGLLVAALILNGCASGGATPLEDAVKSLLPGDAGHVQQASEIAFASLVVDTGDRSGVLVLGALGGSTTFWPTGNNGMLSLYHEGLQATAGLPEDLLTTRYMPFQASKMPQANKAATAYVPWQQATPLEYRLERLWEDSDGLTRALGADARLSCATPKVVTLPLGEQRVEVCTAQRHWDDGSRSRATLWRDSQSRRLWAVDEVAWPDGPRIQWEVARPWW
ncbi:YjbF family lipoprotein [Halomonas sp. ZH2S]|uniref:YjbF family lipoprotein n=1 Tax=Vreelandella zhuhanensis TaxID=2684210 RepID=A0A7X3H0V7_9GAMM|nr:YjbF family lipoprotein [Halomonas zhuhanensis]MWJ28481.1 YjbF family lipoprotein [Halomonas zhuhanensis]